MNIVFVYSVALLMIATGGPSLALPNLVLHVVLGVALVAATLGHLWLNRNRALTWPASGRLTRWPNTALGWFLKGQDALREFLFIATSVSGVVLMAGGPGVDLHATVGFTVLSLSLIHAGLHRRWFGDRLAKLRASPAGGPSSESVRNPVGR